MHSCACHWRSSAICTDALLRSTSHIPMAPGACAHWESLLVCLEPGSCPYGVCSFRQFRTYAESGTWHSPGGRRAHRCTLTRGAPRRAWHRCTLGADEGGFGSLHVSSPLPCQGTIPHHLCSRRLLRVCPVLWYTTWLPLAAFRPLARRFRRAPVPIPPRSVARLFIARARAWAPRFFSASATLLPLPVPLSHC